MGTTLSTAPLHPITSNIPPVQTEQAPKLTTKTGFSYPSKTLLPAQTDMIGQTHSPLIQKTTRCVKLARLYSRPKLGFLGMYHRFFVSNTSNSIILLVHIVRSLLRDTYHPCTPRRPTRPISTYRALRFSICARRIGRMNAGRIDRL